MDQNFVPGAARRALLVILLALAPAAMAAHHESKGDDASHAVAAVIQSLEDTWNAGDMTGYLARYRRDETLSLTFGNTVVQGWEALNTLFRDSYPDPQRMGRFTIERIDVQMLAKDVALAYGNFTHVFPHETVHGGFSHVLSREADGSWIIRHERTSRGETIETP